MQIPIKVPKLNLEKTFNWDLTITHINNVAKTPMSIPITTAFIKK